MGKNRKFAQVLRYLFYLIIAKYAFLYKNSNIMTAN